MDIPADVIEACADKVHQAWMAERQRQGTPDHVYHFVVDGGGLPCCSLHYPYADLSESTKEYDRVTARAALAGIEAAGYRLVRATD
jgi:hypothetical protein